MNTNCLMLHWDAIIHSYLSRANSFSWLASWEARAWAVRVGPETAPWGWARWPENLPFADRRCFFVVGLLLLLCPFRHRVALPALGPLTLVLTLPLAIMVVHVVTQARKQEATPKLLLRSFSLPALRMHATGGHYITMLPTPVLIGKYPHHITVCYGLHLYCFISLHSPPLTRMTSGISLLCMGTLFLHKSCLQM